MLSLVLKNSNITEVMFFMSNLLSSKLKKDVQAAFLKMGIINKFIIPWFDVLFLTNNSNQIQNEDQNEEEEDDDENDIVLTGKIQLLRMITNFCDQDKNNFKSNFLTKEEIK